MKNRKRPTKECPTCHGEAQLAVKDHRKVCVKVIGYFTRGFDDNGECICPVKIVDCEQCRGNGRIAL